MVNKPLITPDTHALRVYYEDTDCGGVVYYANYLRFFERARTEWLRARGFDQSVLAQQAQILFVVKNANISYHLPARLDDQLLIHTNLEQLRAATLVFKQSAWRASELLAQATVDVCSINALSFKPMRLPESTRQLLNQSLNQYANH